MRAEQTAASQGADDTKTGLAQANGVEPMAQANGSLRNRFAKRHYEAIATAIQEARRRALSDELTGLGPHVRARNTGPIETISTELAVITPE